MKRSDYETNNMSFDSMRPFYNQKTSELQKHSESIRTSFKQMNTIDTPVNPEMVYIKNKVLSGLYSTNDENEGKDKSLITRPMDTRQRKRLKLPKIREKLTLHISDRGPEILDEKE